MDAAIGNRTVSAKEIVTAVFCELVPWLRGATIAALLGIATLLNRSLDAYWIVGIAIFCSLILGFGCAIGGLGWLRINESFIGMTVLGIRIAHAIALFMVFGWAFRDPDWAPRNFFDDLRMPVFWVFAITPGVSALALAIVCLTRRAATEPAAISPLP